MMDTGFWLEIRVIENSQICTGLMRHQLDSNGFACLISKFTRFVVYLKVS